MADATSRGYPFPEGDDAANVHEDIEALAEAVDADIEAVETGAMPAAPTSIVVGGGVANGTDGFIELVRMTADPPAPAGDRLRLYWKSVVGVPTLHTRDSAGVVRTIDQT